MAKFILGYENPIDNLLTEYKTKKEADFYSEEWCEVEADNLEDAKAKYEDSFLLWQKQFSETIKNKKDENK